MENKRNNASSTEGLRRRRLRQMVTDLSTRVADINLRKTSDQTPGTQRQHDGENHEGIENPASESVPREPGKYHCQPCEEARKSKKYTKQVAKLLRPELYCIVCKDFLPPVMFPPWMRNLGKNHFDERKCILHVGRVSLCAHMSFSLDEVMQKDWTTDARCEISSEGNPRIVCKHPDHKASTIEDNNGHRLLNVPYMQLLQVGSLILFEFNVDPRPQELGHHEQSTSEVVGISESQATQVHRVSDALEACAFMFCPHLKMNPGRDGHFDNYKVVSGPHGFQLCCAACQFRIVVDMTTSKGEERCQSIWCNSMIKLDESDASKRDWVAALNPNSYDQFSDDEAKHITWCDDPDCATSFQLLRAHIFHNFVTYDDDSSKDIAEIVDEETEAAIKKVCR
jgi:hypothetical protein